MIRPPHGLSPKGRAPSAARLDLITVLEEDEHGVYYEVQLVDADYTRTLVPGLQADLYRSSFTYEVLARDFVKEPTPSTYNPAGLPELTIESARSVLTQ
jgi:Caudovirus prohead serine protease